MKLITRLLALMLAILTLTPLSATAELQRNELLDVAFTMLEKDNIFLTRYNQITGADVQATFELGLPYFFGGKHDDLIEGTMRVFYRAPEYTKRKCWENTHYYRKDQEYLFGFDCSGYTQWIYDEVGWPAHDKLDAMINQYGKYGAKYHVYSHRKGKEMPPYDEISATLQVGDLLVGKKGARHIMMFIGTLREYGFTAEEVPELAAYLDYPLVIHCGPNPMYNDRMQQYLDEHADDPYYKNVKVPDGGVAVSIIGVEKENVPNHQFEGDNDHYWFELPDGYQLTIWELQACTSFCWFRINGIK